MNTSSKFIAAAAFSLLAAVGAQAETYQGVHAPVSANSRADIAATAVVAAHSANPWATGYGQGVTVVANSTDRSAVRAQAVAAAHSANPYATGYGQGVTVVGSGYVDRAAVQAQARQAAREQLTF